MDVGEPSDLVLIITHNGVKVLECLCGDDIWQIECCPLKSNIHYSTLQKDTKHYCKAKIISKQTNLVLCWLLSTTKGVSIELHKFWFCHDDLNHCVGGTNKKYAFDKLALLSLWHVQVRINFTQIEVVALEEISFLLLEKPKSPFVN